MYFFFVIFIVFGSFFTLNLLIAVIIDKFNEVKNKPFWNGGNDAFLTENQKKIIAAMKKANRRNPVRALPRPKWVPQAIVFDIVTHKKFEAIKMGVVALNLVSIP